MVLIEKSRIFPLVFSFFVNDSSLNSNSLTCAEHMISWDGYFCHIVPGDLL